MVPADSHRVSRAPRYSGNRATPAPTARKGLSPAMAGRSSPFRLTVLVRHCGPTTPAAPKRRRFGLFPGRSPLLGESLLFSLPAGTKMFQFPAFASRSLRDAAFRRRVVPFGDLRVKPNRRLSQLPTSFIASLSLGIHHAPFFNFDSFPQHVRDCAFPAATLSGCRPCLLLVLYTVCQRSFAS